jgi:hypothetical protein
LECKQFYTYNSENNSRGHIFLAILNDFATNRKKKNIRDLYRGINYFKRGYQPRSNLVKDENSDLLTDSQKILNWWKNNFSVIECT